MPAHHTVGGLAHAGRVMTPGLGLSQLAQLARPLVQHARRHGRAQPRRGRAGPLAVRKDVQIGEGQRGNQRHGRSVIVVGLAREAGDDVRPESEHRQPGGEPLQAGSVRLGRVPVAAHALEHAVGSRLQRGMQMGREMPGGLDQEPGNRVIDLGGFDRGEPEADGGDGGDQRLEQVSQGRPTPGPCPGVIGTRNLL